MSWWPHCSLAGYCTSLVLNCGRPTIADGSLSALVSRVSLESRPSSNFLQIKPPICQSPLRYHLRYYLASTILLNIELRSVRPTGIGLSGVREQPGVHNHHRHPAWNFGSHLSLLIFPRSRFGPQRHNLFINGLQTLEPWKVKVQRLKVTGWHTDGTALRADLRDSVYHSDLMVCHNPSTA